MRKRLPRISKNYFDMSTQTLQKWEKTQLGDVLTLNYGKGLPARDRVNGDFPVYGSAGIVGHHNKPIAKAPGIIVGRKGSIGEIYFSKKDYYPIDTSYYINSSDKYDIRFIYYLLKQLNLKTLNTDAAVPGLNRTVAYQQKVLIPNLSVQRSIAGILLTYDDLIENNTRRIQILEQMAQAIYIEWFVNFRFPGHEKVKMIDSGTDFGKIPEGWEVLQVEDIIQRVSPGKLYDNKTVLTNGKVPVLDQGRSGIIGYHNDEPGVAASIEKPVIVFANHTCYQRLMLFSFSAIQNVLPFYPSEEKFRNIFWLHYATKDLIRSNDYKGHWPEYMQKRLVVPPADISDKFCSQVKPLILMTYQLELANKNLRQTRDLLLPKLVTGEIKI